MKREKGAKRPFSKIELAAIKAHLNIKGDKREMVMFHLGFDTMLRSCDLIGLRISDITHPDGSVNQNFRKTTKKTGKSVPIQLSDETVLHVKNWLRTLLKGSAYVFPGQAHGTHLSTKQHERVVKGWAQTCHADPSQIGTHSMRKAKPAMIYEKTGNIRAIQQLLGHSSMATTERYIGVSELEAIEIAKDVTL